MRRSTLYRALLAGLCAGASPSIAQELKGVSTGDAGFRIQRADSEQLGQAVSGAGDVNGDGWGDVIVSDPQADRLERAGVVPDAGRAYVVFGGPGITNVDLAQLGGGGFRINGVGENHRAGSTVSSAGDANGDGLDDLLISAPGAQPELAYLVFGKADSVAVDLGQLGPLGFPTQGMDTWSGFGDRISGAGDVNGDGLADIVVGSPKIDQGGTGTEEGKAFVVFGKTDSATIDLAALGDGGFEIRPPADGDIEALGASVAGAGDVNGDGLDDVIVGAFGSAPDGKSRAGSAFVIFGKADTTLVDLAFPAGRGFRINGVDQSDYAGWNVSGAGDVNGDGLDDVVLSALYAGSVWKAYVVFGKASAQTVELETQRGGGFVIEGGAEQVSSVAGAGDINGDGLSDVLIGTTPYFEDGAAYIIFGKTGSGAISTEMLGTDGVRIDGAAAFDETGSSVGAAGDVDGDGLADVVIGAPSGNGDRGEALVVFSREQTTPSATYEARARNDDAPRQAIGTAGDGSNASHPDSRTWIDFADGQDPMGPASPVEVTLTRGAGGFVDAAADVSWEITSSRQGWSSAELRFRYTDAEQIGGNENTLQLYFSPDGNAPYLPLASSVVNPVDNTISAVVDQLGYFYIGTSPQAELVFANGFEP